MSKMRKKSEKSSLDGFKRYIWNAVIFVALIVATFWFVFKDQDLNAVFDVVASANPLYILLGLALMSAYFLIQARNVHHMLKLLGEKITYPQALRYTLIEFFFCAVTPGASGGQPVEVYYMTKDKISGANATLALLVQTCCIQVAIVVLGTVSAVFNTVMFEGAVFWLFVFGFIINAVALFILLACIFSPKLTRKLVIGTLKALRSIGFKTIGRQIPKAEEGLARYAESSVFIKKHKPEFIKSIFRVLVQMSCFYLVPFCVYHAFGLSGASVFELFAMQAILYVATSGLPIPGAVGVSESVFLTLYGAFFGEAMVSGAMLLGRGISFYWFVLVGMLVVFVSSMRLRRATQKRP